MVRDKGGGGGVCSNLFLKKKTCHTLEIVLFSPEGTKSTSCIYTATNYLKGYPAGILGCCQEMPGLEPLGDEGSGGPALCKMRISEVYKGLQILRTAHSSPVSDPGNNSTKHEGFGKYSNKNSSQSQIVASQLYHPTFY